MSGTHQEASSSSVSLSSKTTGNLELGTEEQHGFSLSPIHVSDPQVMGSESKREHSLPLDRAKLREEGMNVERKPSSHTIMTGSSDGGDIRVLLEKRSSKPSLLSAEDVPVVGTTLQSLLSSSTESTISQHSSANSYSEHPDKKLTPLAPLTKEPTSTFESGVAKRVESVTSATSKDSCILKPLEAEKPGSEAILGRRASGKPDLQDASAAILMSGPALERGSSKTDLSKKASTHSMKSDLQDTGAPALVSVSTKEPALETEMTATQVSLGRKDSMKDRTDLQKASTPILTFVSTEGPALETERSAKTETGLLKKASAHPTKPVVDAPVLMSVDTERSTSTRNGSDTVPARTAQLATVHQPSVSEHAKTSPMAPSTKATDGVLATVTDAPNSSVTDFIAQLAELKSSSLVVDEPPPITSSQQKSQLLQSQLRGSPQAIDPSLLSDDEDEHPSVTNNLHLQSHLEGSTEPSLVMDKPHHITSTQQSSHLQSKLQSSAQPPPATSTRLNSRLLSQLKDSTQQDFGGDDRPHHFTPFYESALSDELYQPAPASDTGAGSDDFDIQNIIRAIACEEIASVGRDILETKRKQFQSPPSVPRGAERADFSEFRHDAKLKPSQKGVGRLKADASISRQQKDVGHSHQEQKRAGALSRDKKNAGVSSKTMGARNREQKDVGIMNKEKKSTAARRKAWQGSAPQGQGSVKKTKPGLHSSRESLASKSDSSVQKKATRFTRSQLSNREKEDNFSHPGKLTKKSNLSQRSSKKGASPLKTGPAHFRHEPKLSPKAVHRPYSPTMESPTSSPPSSLDLKVDYNIHSSEVPKGKTYSEQTTAEAFRREVIYKQDQIECSVLLVFF